MPRHVSSSRDIDTTTSLHYSYSSTGCVSLRGLSSSCVYWCTAAYTVWLRITSLAAFNACPTSQHKDIYVRQEHYNWSYLPPAVWHSAIRRFLSPLHAPGTPFHIQYHLHRRSLFSDDFWRRIYFVVVFICSFYLFSAPEAVHRESVTFNLVDYEWMNEWTQHALISHYFLSCLTSQIS